MKKIFDELKMTGRLPSPPGVGMAIIKLTESDDYELEDVSRVIRSDPALAGRVLKLCNSGAKAGIRPITSIDEAIQRLGIKTLRTVTLGFSLISSYREGTCPNFDFGAFWAESLARAIAAQQTALDCRFSAPADAYACGLLSGIGRLALACVHPDEYGRILARPEAALTDGRLQLEREAFEIDSDEVTAALLADWGIPRHIVLAVTASCSRQLEVEAPQVKELARIIKISVAIARVCSSGERVAEGEIEDMAEAQLQSALGQGDFHALCDRVAVEWRAWGGILELPTRDLPSFSTLTTTAPGSEEGPVPRPLRILAVDDDRVSLKILAHHLESLHHEVILAHDGEEALSLAIRCLPDIVVSDMRMPKLDGFGLVKGLRRCEEGRQMYFIMLTGADDEEHVVASFEAGIDDYVLKPFNPRILMARIRAGERVTLMQRQLEADHRQMREQMSALSVLNRKLQQASLTDPLTQLPNRRFAMEHLQTTWAEAQRHDDQVVAIMIDIDHFKNVNDRYGHDVGDEVLRQTATVLNNAVREYECVCRLGGEEFLVVCSRAGVDEGMKLAERLRKVVENNQISFGGFEGGITISLGVAATQPKVEGYEQLLRAADEAVYIAKRSGRNRVCNSRDCALV